eukprot:CAMPEP_0117442276 /NCGR_PEP_ID=MMETSP0759-20121206/4067_1 /TAXON_ID=63605 /ORGANISM="Percolomonas cosmopolitus, Strain WS" /LENGTH=800 /DNA_ID=CAMNT_0005234157 /DNA_START=8 /DNA_END=2410 /DNA_ORIENTATION=+
MSSSSLSYKPYKFAHILSDHTNEVRSVCRHPIFDNACVTASYDGTIKLWLLKDNESNAKAPPTYSLELTYISHTDYVMTVASSSQNIYSSGHDKKVVQWSNGMDAVAQVEVENAHEEAISRLAVNGDRLMSASWDKTAKVWDISGGQLKGQPVAVLKGHTNHVDAVCILPNGSYVTGSRDKALKMWDSNGRCTSTVSDAHQGSVRGFCVVPQLGFASCGSDGLIRLWTNKGNPITNWTAHDSLVYDVSYVASTAQLKADTMSDEDEGLDKGNGPLLVTSSEDQSIKIWSPDGLLRQHIEFPSCVWQTALLSNGDLLVACGDMNAYVLTIDASRVAVSTEQVENIRKKIIESKEKRTGVDPSQLEDVSVLSTLKGTKNGDKKMVNENGQSMIYIWNGGEWEKFGAVVDDPSLQGKQLNKEDGKFYDRVWKVEVSDGVQITLGYNLGDDPTRVAIEFCQENNLESYLVDQIVEFIMKNTGQDYKPNMSNQFGSFDPYASMEREEGKTTSALDQEREKDHFPLKKPELVTGMPKPEAVVKKILSLNEELQKEGNQNVLSADDIKEFETQCQQLSSPSSAKYSEEFFSVLEKMLKWPQTKQFPVFDVLRVVFLSADAETYFTTRNAQHNKNIAKEIVNNCMQDSSNFALTLMALRTLINMCQWSNLKPLITDSIEDIQKTVPVLNKASKDPVRLTIGRFLVNLSYVAHSESANFKLQVLDIVNTLKGISKNLGNTQGREEYAYDVVRSVGTLCLISILKAEESVCKAASPKFTAFCKQYERTSVQSVKLQAASYQLLQVFSSVA